MSQVSLDFDNKNSTTFRIDYDFVLYGQNLLSNSSFGVFYGSQVYFSELPRAYKYLIYQMLGNLGGIMTDRPTDIDSETLCIVLNDQQIKNLKNGVFDAFISNLENKMNNKARKDGSKHRRIAYDSLRFISKDFFIKFIEERAKTNNDKSTNQLIKIYHEKNCSH